MPVELYYDSSRHILRGTVSNPLDRDDIDRLMKEIVDAEDFPPDTPAIYDLRGLDFRTFDKGFAERLIEIRRHYPRRGNARIALIAPDDLGFGMTRMYQLLSDDLDQAIMVFRSVEEGEQWLMEGEKEPLS